MSLDITINNEQQVEVRLSPKTPSGRPAVLDGAPTWTVVSGEATLHPRSDGLGCLIVSPDTPGDSVILVEADADLGSGIETVAETVRLTVEGARASSLGISAGDPQPKPVVEPPPPTE